MRNAALRCALGAEGATSDPGWHQVSPTFDSVNFFCKIVTLRDELDRVNSLHIVTFDQPLAPPEHEAIKALCLPFEEKEQTSVSFAEPPFSRAI